MFVHCEFSLIKFYFSFPNIFWSAFVSKYAVIVTNMMLALNWWKSGPSMCSLHSHRKLVCVFRFCLKSTENFYSHFNLCLAMSLLNLLSFPAVIFSLHLCFSSLSVKFIAWEQIQKIWLRKERRARWIHLVPRASGEPRRCQYNPGRIQGSNTKCCVGVNVGSVCPN